MMWLLTTAQAASTLRFNNPSIPAQLLCSKVTFSWSGGVPAYELQIMDATTEAVIEDFRGTAGTSLEWVADGKVEGKNVVAKIIDSTGQSAITKHIPVSPGSPNACPQNIAIPSSAPSTLSFTTIVTITPPSSAPSSRATIETTSKSSPRDTSVSQSPTGTRPLPSSAPDAASSISSASTTGASSTTTSIPVPPVPSSPPASAPAPTQPPSVASSTALSVPTYKSPPPASPSPAKIKPPSKAAIATPIVALVVGIGAILLYWLCRRAAQKRKVVRSSGRRADLDLQESCPLLSEPAAPGRAVVARRAWAGPSLPWRSSEQSAFAPDDENDILVIRRPRPRSTDAQASLWQSDFASAATASPGYTSFLSATGTGTRPWGPKDRRTDSPIDSLTSLFPAGSTRPSSQYLLSTHRDVAAYMSDGRPTGMETGSPSGFSKPLDEGEWDDLSDTGTTTTLPPPYYHYAM
ncbi:hypothetical protein GSI_08854 [Ganoderma sinense ZZ0214-1]|uniref:Uncharacterized protein n=1 Tax=Ganoderma sinense ZZ0214-1 TaxID=1077348 RepID=A0A2G8S4W0_9APHY|nr:hypothetical protein GSI_08854 [Ganoderma sinense ZZ0214-1]